MLKPVDLHIIEPIRRIMDRWGNKDNSGKNYIFDVYHKGMTAEEMFKVKQKAIRRINDAMKRLKARAGINQKVTTYVSRHTWATYLINNDASIAYNFERLRAYVAKDHRELSG